jgi:hypothetical protein
MDRLMTIDEIQKVITSNLTDEQRFCEHIEALYDFNEYDNPYQVSLKYCPNCGKKNHSRV